MSDNNSSSRSLHERTGFDRHVLAVAGVVVLGAIMSILDTTIVNIAIADLAKEFNTNLSTIQWVSTGYLLALATVIPLTGWAADRFGTKRLFMTSIVLFLIGSALSGAAWSAESLIGFRVLQGIGGGMIMPAGMTILTQTAGPDRVGRMMSIIGVPMLMGPIIGPILGGWLVDDISWRWIFYVNLPIGALVLPLALRILPKDKPHHADRLDWLGLALLSPGLASFVYGLAEIATSGGISSPSAFGPMLAGVLLIATFVWHALRKQGALLDVRLFATRPVGSAAGTTILFGAAFFGVMFLLPLYFQIVRGESALTAGLLLAPQGLGAAMMMPAAGLLTDRIGPRKVVLTGLSLITVGMVSLTQLTAHTSYFVTFATLIVLGFGMGATMMPAMAAAYQTLTHQQVARATSALNIIQRVGGSIGIALVSVVLATQLSNKLPALQGGSIGAVHELPPGAQQQVAPVIADAFGHTFWWSLALTLVAFGPAMFLSNKAAKPVDPVLVDGAAGRGASVTDAPLMTET